MKRVEIPKPDGGVRKLGIPTVLDRFIQQAVIQVLQRKWHGMFSEHSDGFRPGRSAHQAVAKAQPYIAHGYRFVVDLDLEKFFDRVNHDRLMAKLAEKVSAKPMLKLIRAFLTPGVRETRMSSGVGGVARLPPVPIAGQSTSAHRASRVDSPAPIMMIGERAIGRSPSGPQVASASPIETAA